MPPTIPARFRPISDAALVTGRSYRTIQTWARQKRIARMEHPRTGAVLVDLVAAARLSEEKGRRNRSKTDAAA